MEINFMSVSQLFVIFVILGSIRGKPFSFFGLTLSYLYRKLC